MKSILLAIMLASTTTAASQFSPEFDRAEFYTVIKTHETKADLNNAYDDQLKKAGSMVDKKPPKSIKRFRAWSFWTKQEVDGLNYCIIHIVKPKSVHSSKEREIGHEMMHCMYGDYHEYNE